MSAYPDIILRELWKFIQGSIRHGFYFQVVGNRVDVGQMHKKMMCNDRGNLEIRGNTEKECFM